MCCSGIDPAVASVLSAKENALRAQVTFAVAAKQLDAVEQQGDAINQLIEQAAQLGKSLDTGKRFDAAG
jgi:hypothetical protein